MNGLRGWVNQHPILSFILVTYGFSWGLWAVMIAAWGTINWLGSFGPLVGALAVVAITRGRAGLKDLLQPILKGRFGLGWYQFILVGCVLVLLLGVWVHVLLGGVSVLPRDIVLRELPLIPIYFLIVFGIGGPLGEEIGWRGYLLPHLLKERDPLYASLIVWVIWFGWHLPLFWIPGASQHGVSIPAFVLFIAAWTILFTWVYMGTRRSLISVLLLHTSINTLSLFMQQVDPAHMNDPLLIQAIISSILALIVIITDKRMTRPAEAAQPAEPPRRQETPKAVTP